MGTVGFRISDLSRSRCSPASQADFASVSNYATAKEGDDIALGLSLAVAKNLTSKTWLSGLSDFMEVLSDPERYGERWALRMPEQPPCRRSPPMLPIDGPVPSRDADGC
jgi:hypothetical protein